MKADFGKKLLERYGWTDGEGIGKNKNGISKPLKVAIKKDKEGLGFDRSLEFSEKWWEDVYKKASKNIKVDDDNQSSIKSKCSPQKMRHKAKRKNKERSPYLQTSTPTIQEMPTIYNKRKQKGKLQRILSQEQNFHTTLPPPP